MHIVVCIKQVPDSAQIRVHPVTNTIMRQGVPAIINPYDLFALEEALRLKDKHGGTVTVITMGPPQAEGALRKALSYGADDAILITDRAFAGADTLATSFALASAIRQIQKNMPVDMVFTGKQTIDGDTAQVGPGVAKRLDFQLLTYVSKVSSVLPEQGQIVVERRAEGGVQLLKSKLPCLITILEGNNEMRFATMPNMFRAARHPVKMWNRESAGISDDDLVKIGLKGSPTVVSKVFAPTPHTDPAEMIEVESGNPKDIADTVLAKMFTRFPAVAKEIAKRA
ncbi:electron transfer flavoprotein subunit beta [Sulfurimicrobium lacus]|uniref:Protein FixA n=1 Tax=Sulfurimicrobium lacus TaxID=2715678 RepID=A0A6F8V830_9PROT|nr:electron transfer flavoprotein subunit beta/FixA family protein [Sulfurimicrobium lacus]BCB25993.1 electron transfer flavoprotein subunit beta [Sulfurimicrobium lacus]